MNCPECNRITHYLDLIMNKRTGKTFFLRVCRNPDCSNPGQVYNDELGTWEVGDPSGSYPNRLEVEAT